MITAQSLDDLALVKRIMTDESIWPHISEDGSPEPGSYEPPDISSVSYVLMLDDDEILGLFMLAAHNTVMAEIHTCLFPWARGSRALKAAKTMERWVWENTGFKRLITVVPACNRIALSFAKRAGMVQYGLNPKSYAKNDVLWDSVLLGLTRPEEIAPPCPR